MSTKSQKQIYFQTFSKKYKTLNLHNSTLRGSISNENAFIRKLSTRSSVLERRKYLSLEKRQQIAKTNHFFDMFVFSRIFLHCFRLSEVYIRIFRHFSKFGFYHTNPIDQAYKPYRPSIQTLSTKFTK